MDFSWKSIEFLSSWTYSLSLSPFSDSLSWTFYFSSSSSSSSAASTTAPSVASAALLLLLLLPLLLLFLLSIPCHYNILLIGDLVFLCAFLDELEIMCLRTLSYEYSISTTTRTTNPDFITISRQQQVSFDLQWDIAKKLEVWNHYESIANSENATLYRERSISMFQNLLPSFQPSALIQLGIPSNLTIY